jgi:hypothetical protein
VELILTELLFLTELSFSLTELFLSLTELFLSLTELFLSLTEPTELTELDFSLYEKSLINVISAGEATASSVFSVNSVREKVSVSKESISVGDKNLFV